MSYKPYLLITVFLALVLLSACPARQDGSRPATGEPPETGSVPAVTGAESAGPEPIELTEGPKQFVLIYTGDTLSIPTAARDYDPPEGGLSGLTAAVTDYEALITDFTRQRIINAGGNADGIRTDLTNGILGEHPFLLVDYGGWERPNDFAGEYYVELYLNMFKNSRYHAVGVMHYETLPPERWAAYLPVAPDGLTLLNSAGTATGATLPTIPIITREIHGARWGVVSLPLPEQGDDFDERLAGFLDEAAALLTQENCAASILLLAGAPPRIYNELATAGRFTVVVGAKRRTAVPDGYGVLSATGALLLPEVNPGGRSFGVCHFYYHDEALLPDMFYFTAKPCPDDGSLPLPYRHQVAAARLEHDAVVQQQMAPPDSGN